jgi:hypothetical protein
MEMVQRSHGDETVRIADAHAHEAVEEHRPPYDLTTDLLITGAFLPTRPLRRVFPQTPFLSLLGRTVAIVYFSQVTDGWYSNVGGQRRRLGDGRTPLYAELNVLTALWRRAVVAPGIYATSDLSIQIGRGYGMPKRSIAMRYVASDAGRVRTETRDGQRMSGAWARPLGSGRLLTAIARRILPRWTWPVCFPSGRAVCARLPGMSVVRIARVRTGRLALSTDWLPRSVRLMPLAVSVTGLRMRLPSPNTDH